jgi:hypothetical protein
VQRTFSGGGKKDEGYYSTLIGRYLMDSEMKFREFFRVSRDIFHLILKEIKEDITIRSCNRWQTLISAEQKLCLMLRYVGKQATICNIVLLIILIQSVTTITLKCKYTNHLNLNSSAKLEVLGSNSSFALLFPFFPF